MARPRERLDRVLAQQTTLVRRAFALFLADVRSEAVVSQMAALLEAGRAAEAMGIVDSYVRRLGTIFNQAYQQSGAAEAASLTSLLQAEDARLAVTFDPTQPRAAAQMRERTLGFVAQFSEQQRQVVRRVVAEGLEQGLGSRAISRRFRESIGLTTHQLDAVDNYRRLLEGGSREALERQLRDRRFDATVARAADAGEPLGQAQIERMVERYRDRYLDYRAETISRDQAREAVNAAREESRLQMVEQTGMDPERVIRVWRTNKDGRERESHNVMDGQERGLDEPFESGAGHLLLYPGDLAAPPEERIQCRCTIVLRILPPS